MLALLLDSSIRATLVIAVAAMILLALRIRNASFRHATLAAVTVVMLTMPALVRWVPGLWLPFLPEGPQPVRAPIVVEMSRTPGIAALPNAPQGVDTIPDYSFTVSWQTLALSMYGFGAALLLLRLVIGTYRVHRLVAESMVDRGRLVHPRCSTPIAVGWLQPVVILPPSWAEWPRERLAAVMAHEAQHIRRRDPLVQWLALLNRAIFWFHPLAWWLERELGNLAEAACDESVLEQGIDSRDYSNALVFLAQAAHESGARVQLGTAMPGPALYGRLRTILDGGRPQPVSAWRLVCLATAISGTVFIFSTARLAMAQPVRAFEVASIKPAAPGANGRFVRLTGPGQISIKNFNLKDMIQWAYGPGSLNISGGPKWMDSMSANDSFDIEAKGAADATPAQIREMGRSLLVERFGLKVHTEQKEVAAYALVPARADRKLGPKITDMTGKDCESGRPSPPDAAMPRCQAFISPAGLTMEGATMKHLADMLSIPIADLGRPVVDRTNIPGDFKVNLEFTFRVMPDGPRTGETGPSLFTALQEQLGLKLENARASIEVLVIDQAERPTEN